MLQQVHISRHPLILHKMALLRDVGTPSPAFRRLIHELAQMLFLAATEDLPLSEWAVQTPLAACRGQRLAGSRWLRP